jgi:hypothetical protein
VGRCYQRKRRTDRNHKAHEVPSLLDDWLETDFYFGSADDAGMTAAEMVSHMDARGHTLREQPPAGDGTCCSPYQTRVKKRKIIISRHIWGLERLDLVNNFQPSNLAPKVGSKNEALQSLISNLPTFPTYYYNSSTSDGDRVIAIKKESIYIGNYVGRLERLEA